MLCCALRIDDLVGKVSLDMFERANQFVDKQGDLHYMFAQLDLITRLYWGSGAEALKWILKVKYIRRDKGVWCNEYHCLVFYGMSMLRL